MAKSKTSQRGKPSSGKGLHGRPAQRARAMEARRVAESEERRRTLRSRLLFSLALLLAVGGITAGVVLSKSGDGGGGTATLTATQPPWPAPTDTSAYIKAANLRSATKETLEEHYHSHLDIRADGQPVDIPTNIGISQTQRVIAEMHTHDTTGLIHVEAPDKTRTYTLGQFFTEWGVKLDATHLGGYTAGDGKTLAAFLDGKRFEGNPADIQLKEHLQIALMFGTADMLKNPPATFDFKAAGV